ncbi:MAG: DUF3416 domain-containing protein, partial [Thaumarchaeota archaeon]|nr:DUF3416 domain-containing protein [Nitrososphaerota archaeon]
MQRNYGRESSQSAKKSGSQTGVSNSNEKTLRFIAIESVAPQIDCGRYPVKRIIGDTLKVHADIIKPGHDKVYVLLKHRLGGEAQWNQTPMVYSYDDDCWHSSFQLKELGTYEYCIEASTDHFATLLEAIEKWAALGEDISADVEEIRKILEVTKNSSTSDELVLITDVASAINGKMDVPKLLEKLEDPELARIVNQRVKKIDIATSPLFSVVVDPPKSQFSSWYEMFHRSQGAISGTSATFQDCEKRLDDISRMGFDVIYLPP